MSLADVLSRLGRASLPQMTDIALIRLNARVPLFVLRKGRRLGERDVTYVALPSAISGMHHGVGFELACDKRLD